MILNIDDLAYTLSRYTFQKTDKIYAYKCAEKIRLYNPEKFSWLCCLYLAYVLDSRYIEMEPFVDFSTTNKYGVPLTPEMEEKIRRNHDTKEWYERITGKRI